MSRNPFLFPSARQQLALPGRFCAPEAIFLAFHIVKDLHSTSFVFPFHKPQNRFSPMTAADPAEAEIA